MSDAGFGTAGGAFGGQRFGHGGFAQAGHAAAGAGAGAGAAAGGPAEHPGAGGMPPGGAAAGPLGDWLREPPAPTWGGGFAWPQTGLTAPEPTRPRLTLVQAAPWLMVGLLLALVLAGRTPSAPPAALPLEAASAAALHNPPAAAAAADAVPPADTGDAHVMAAAPDGCLGTAP